MELKTGSIFFLLFLLTIFFTAQGFANSNNNFLVGGNFGLNINTKPTNQVDRIVPLHNFSTSLSFIQKNKKALGSLTSIALVSNAVKYQINPSSYLTDYKLKIRFSFAISLLQNKHLHLYSGLFTHTTFYQGAIFSVYNSNAAFLNNDVLLAEEFFKSESKKINAGFHFSGFYFLHPESKKDFYFSFNIFQNLLKEYQTKFQIGKILPSLNYYSSGVNPLLTEVNLGVGLCF
ncbi:MAG: hypothetical protein RIQ33_2028 [Bacteroidota bacterium]|jgi:hypothetical protein